MKYRATPKGRFWLCGLLTVFALIAPGPMSAQAVITQIIDGDGDGGGNTLGSPRAIAVDGAGNVYVAGRTTGNAFKITPGGVITEIIDTTGDGGGNFTLNEPIGIAVDGAGNVYVAGRTSNNVFKIATPGTCSTGGTPCTITKIIDVTGDGIFGHGFSGSSGQSIAVDGAGNVYVTGSGSFNAYKIATPGTCSTGGTPCTITQIIDITGDGAGNTLSGPRGIAVDGPGNVYLVTTTKENAFKIATPGTCSTGGTPCTITQIIDSTGDGGGNSLDSPWAIAVDGPGNVYVGGRVNTDNVFKIATPGTCSTGGTPCTITEIIDATGDGAGNTFENPLGIAADGSGNVYVTGNDSFNAFKISTPGTCSTGGTPCTITEIIDSTGDGVNNLNNSFGIAVDGSDNVYVTGVSPTRVFKIGEPVFLIPALSLRGSLIALLLLFLGAGVALLSRRRSQRVASA